MSQQQWFVRKGNEEKGPLTPQQLKQMAESGELVASDLVKTTSMADWRSAGKVKGLFEEKTSTTEPTSASSPPVDSSENLTVTVKSDLKNLMSSAKQAKNQAVARARRTQLSQINLPKAYFALGKHIVDNNLYRDEFAELYQKIDAITADIGKVKSSHDERTPASSLKGKLQAGAAMCVAQGKATKLGLDRDSVVRELGKRAYETNGDNSSPPEMIAAIKSVLDEIESLDKKIQAAIPPSDVPYWNRLTFQILLTALFFPVGFYLVWKNPRLSQRTKKTWIVVSSVVIALIVIGHEMDKAKVRQDILTAHKLWASGDKQSAVSKYRVLITQKVETVPEIDKALVFGRIIDFDADSGDKASAEKLFRQAEDIHVVPSISSGSARSIRERRTTEASINDGASASQRSELLMTVDALYSAYRGNSVAGSKRYTGKTITVLGKVHSVKSMFLVGTVIFMEGQYEPGIKMGCTLTSQSSRSKELETVRAGDYVRLTGICEGPDIAGTVSFKSCTFVIAASQNSD